MSISSFCLQQREKEKAALKNLLAYSVAGSAALHLVLAFGIALVWPKEPSLADDPIELIVIDSPEPEVVKPEEKAPAPPPKPKPQPVVTPPPEKPTATITPKPIAIPKFDTPPPPKVVELPKPVVPAPLSQPTEPPVPEPAPISPPPQKPVTTSEPLPPPKISQPPTPSKPEPVAANNPPVREKPLQTPSADSRPFRDVFTESKPTETAKDETPKLPGGLTANQQPPANNSTAASQPLQPSAPENRTFRDSFTTSNNSPSAANPADDPLLTAPEAPGEVAANRAAPPSKPTAVSQPLQASSSSNREFRDSFSNSNSSLSSGNPGDESSSTAPGLPGEVTTNRQPPANRPIARSQPLQASGSSHREFRDSFSSSNSSPFGSDSDSDFSPTTPGTSQGVAANQGVPPKPRPAERGNEGTGRNRRATRRGSAAGLRCISECKPQYPSNVQNVEGRPEVRFVVESDGSTTDPELAQSSGNSELDQAAIEAVQKMRFAPPSGGAISVRLAINFVTSGSNFERQARERQQENERQRRERERQQQQEQLENIDAENPALN